jgi:hypothetical protein
LPDLIRRSEATATQHAFRPVGQRDKHELSQDPTSPPITFLHLTAVRSVGEELVAERATVEQQPTTINGEATLLSDKPGSTRQAWINADRPDVASAGVNMRSSTTSAPHD